jgi:hypothetical protein
MKKSWIDRLLKEEDKAFQAHMEALLKLHRRIAEGNGDDEVSDSLRDEGRP